MKRFRSIKATEVNGIRIEALSDHTVREVGRLLLDICNCRASDNVKVAALEALKSKLSAPMTISGCQIDMG